MIWFEAQLLWACHTVFPHFPCQGFLFPQWETQFPNFLRISPEISLNSTDFPMIPTDCPWFPNFLCSFQYNFTSVHRLWVSGLFYAYYMYLCYKESTSCETKNYKSGEILGKSDEKLFFRFHLLFRVRNRAYISLLEILIPLISLVWLPWKLVKTPVIKSESEFTGKREYLFLFILFQLPPTRFNCTVLYPFTC